MFLNNFCPEDDPLRSKRAAAINNTHVLVMLTELYPFVL